MLTAQSFDVLFQVRLGPSRLCLPVSLGDCTISRRIVMNNAGYTGPYSICIKQDERPRTDRGGVGSSVNQ